MTEAEKSKEPEPEIEAAGGEEGAPPEKEAAEEEPEPEVPADLDDDMDSEVDDEARTKLENCKYYTSLILGTVCIVCIFAFLFLVPFVLDPAISTLLHEFVDAPATCRISSVEIRHGKSNCKWTSCREGCTATMYTCYQVRVQYSRREWINGTRESDISDFVELTRFDDWENDTKTDTPLLVNIKGCGYPPDIDCKAFVAKYENISEAGLTFPCYYSKANPWIVLETYNFSDNMASVVASIVIPNVIFVASLIVLLYWYCPYCQARCHKYEEQSDHDKDEW